jgi:hypothetical protein
VSRPVLAPPWVSTLALLLALVSEGYDLQAANFAAPSIVKAFGISKAAVGPLLSASLLGVKEARHLFALPLIPLGVAALAALWLRRRIFSEIDHPLTKALGVNHGWKHAQDCH